jgi:hypothetical protein
LLDYTSLFLHEPVSRSNLISDSVLLADYVNPSNPLGGEPEYPRPITCDPPAPQTTIYNYLRSNNLFQYINNDSYLLSQAVSTGLNSLLLQLPNVCEPGTAPTPEPTPEPCPTNLPFEVISAIYDCINEAQVLARYNFSFDYNPKTLGQYEPNKFIMNALPYYECGQKIDPPPILEVEPVPTNVIVNKGNYIVDFPMPEPTGYCHAVIGTNITASGFSLKSDPVLPNGGFVSTNQFILKEAGNPWYNYVLDNIDPSDDNAYLYSYLGYYQYPDTSEPVPVAGLPIVTSVLKSKISFIGLGLQVPQTGSTEPGTFPHPTNYNYSYNQQFYFYDNAARLLLPQAPVDQGNNYTIGIKKSDIQILFENEQGAAALDIGSGNILGSSNELQINNAEPEKILNVFKPTSNLNSFVYGATGNVPGSSGNPNLSCTNKILLNSINISQAVDNEQFVHTIGPYNEPTSVPPGQFNQPATPIPGSGTIWDSVSFNGCGLYSEPAPGGYTYPSPPYARYMADTMVNRYHNFVDGEELKTLNCISGAGESFVFQTIQSSLEPAVDGNLTKTNYFILGEPEYLSGWVETVSYPSQFNEPEFVNGGGGYITLPEFANDLPQIGNISDQNSIACYFSKDFEPEKKNKVYNTLDPTIQEYLFLGMQSWPNYDKLNFLGDPSNSKYMTPFPSFINNYKNYIHTSSNLFIKGDIPTATADEEVTSSAQFLEGDQETIVYSNFTQGKDLLSCYPTTDNLSQRNANFTTNGISYGTPVVIKTIQDAKQSFTVKVDPLTTDYNILIASEPQGGPAASIPLKVYVPPDTNILCPFIVEPTEPTAVNPNLQIPPIFKGGDKFIIKNGAECFGYIPQNFACSDYELRLEPGPNTSAGPTKIWEGMQISGSTVFSDNAGSQLTQTSDQCRWCMRLGNHIRGSLIKGNTSTDTLTKEVEPGVSFLDYISGNNRDSFDYFRNNNFIITQSVQKLLVAAQHNFTDPPYLSLSVPVWNLYSYSGSPGADVMPPTMLGLDAVLLAFNPSNEPDATNERTGYFYKSSLVDNYNVEPSVQSSNLPWFQALSRRETVSQLTPIEPEQTNNTIVYKSMFPFWQAAGTNTLEPGTPTYPGEPSSYSPFTPPSGEPSAANNSFINLTTDCASWRMNLIYGDKENKASERVPFNDIYKIPPGNAYTWTGNPFGKLDTLNLDPTVAENNKITLEPELAPASFFETGPQTLDWDIIQKGFVFPIYNGFLAGGQQMGLVQSCFNGTLEFLLNPKYNVYQYLDYNGDQGNIDGKAKNRNTVEINQARLYDALAFSQNEPSGYPPYNYTESSGTLPYTYIPYQDFVIEPSAITPNWRYCDNISNTLFRCLVQGNVQFTGTNESEWLKWGPNIVGSNSIYDNFTKFQKGNAYLCSQQGQSAYLTNLRVQGINIDLENLYKIGYTEEGNQPYEPEGSAAGGYQSTKFPMYGIYDSGWGAVTAEIFSYELLGAVCRNDYLTFCRVHRTYYYHLFTQSGGYMFNWANFTAASSSYIDPIDINSFTDMNNFVDKMWLPEYLCYAKTCEPSPSIVAEASLANNIEVNSIGTSSDVNNTGDTKDWLTGGWPNKDYMPFYFSNDTTSLNLGDTSNGQLFPQDYNPPKPDSVGAGGPLTKGKAVPRSNNKDDPNNQTKCWVNCCQPYRGKRDSGPQANPTTDLPKSWTTPQYLMGYSPVMSNLGINYYANEPDKGTEYKYPKSQEPGQDFEVATGYESANPFFGVVAGLYTACDADQVICLAYYLAWKKWGTSPFKIEDSKPVLDTDAVDSFFENQESRGYTTGNAEPGTAAAAVLCGGFNCDVADYKSILNIPQEPSGIGNSASGNFTHIWNVTAGQGSTQYSYPANVQMAIGYGVLPSQGRYNSYILNTNALDPFLGGSDFTQGLNSNSPFLPPEVTSWEYMFKATQATLISNNGLFGSANPDGFTGYGNFVYNQKFKDRSLVTLGHNTGPTQIKSDYIAPALYSIAGGPASDNMPQAMRKRWADIYCDNSKILEGVAGSIQDKLYSPAQVID